MSEYSFLSHPEDPSLITIQSNVSKFNSELNNRLTPKIEKLTRRNVKLQEKLMKKDKEISDLRQNNDTLTKTLNSCSFECPNQAQKIADLSKQNRHMNTQLLSVKSKMRDLEKENHQLEDKLNEKERLLEEIEKREEPAGQNEIQNLTETLEKTKKKLFEVSNVNVHLSNELKMAKKCLQQELGVESVNVSQLLNSNSNWRGRAEQISMLQSKISELKEKFDSTDCESYYESNRLPLKRLDSVRRMEIDSLTKELDDCKSELDEVKKKVAALKTRNENISKEANSYKLKTLELMEKSKNDDDYVKCLNEKIAIVRYECEHKINEMKKEVEQIYQLRDESQTKIQNIQFELQNMSEEISAKNDEIANLKMINKQLEDNLRDVSGDFLFSCRNMNKKEYIDLIKVLEREKSNLSNMIKDLNERLNKQIQLQNEQHEIIAKQRVKIARAEGKIKEFVREKEAMKNKHRRGIRINEYSRSMNGQNNSAGRRPTTKSTASHEHFLSEIERLNFKLEVATEKISYLESKLKEQNEERSEDYNKFIEIIGKSKEYFNEIFHGKDGEDDSSCHLDSSFAHTETEVDCAETKDD